MLGKRIYITKDQFETLLDAAEIYRELVSRWADPDGELSEQDILIKIQDELNYINICNIISKFKR